MDKLIITAAICGAEVTKEQNPNVPYTVEEIVREAKSAVDAGAAIVHLHVRWDDGSIGLVSSLYGANGWAVVVQQHTGHTF